MNIHAMNSRILLVQAPRVGLQPTLPVQRHRGASNVKALHATSSTRHMLPGNLVNIAQDLHVKIEAAILWNNTNIQIKKYKYEPSVTTAPIDMQYVAY
jgi:hypothetical protein